MDGPGAASEDLLLRPPRAYGDYGTSMGGCTENNKIMRRHLRLMVDEDDCELPQRPRTRGECSNGPRPCPWVGCSHHLYLDVNPETGAIKLNFAHLEPHELVVSCALDVADVGGVTLDAVGKVMNVSRERIRQLGARALGKLLHPSRDMEDPPEPAEHALDSAAW